MKTVLISGHFNVIHHGHLRLFKYAKSIATKLIIAVESDHIAGEDSHVIESLRLEGVLSNSFVDDAFIFDESVVEIIKRIRPDFVIKGKEFEELFNPELEALESYGGKLLFSSGDFVFSSSDFLKNELREDLSSKFILPNSFLERHNLQKDHLIELIKCFSKKRVLVIGDLIIDEYINCEPLGMSQEDPTIVVTPVESKKFMGGACTQKVKAILCR